MIKNIFFYCFTGISLLLSNIQTSNAQLAIDTNLTVAQLIQNIFVGTGITVSNVTYQGKSVMIGSFANGNTTNLGLTSGVVLASGIVTNIPQPVSSFMSDQMGQPGDADLDLLTGGSGGTQDASVLEFDFIPLSDTLSFRYVFGSEEYPEFVCSSFNDVFGFFITGPNPMGGPAYNKTNIALIPGTNLPVAINTVNQGNLNLSYPTTGCQSLAYDSDFVYNEQLGGTTIVFDGFTKVLRAGCLVKPCVSYHIKLAIADVGDQAYDSGIFLDRNSLSSPGFIVTPNYKISTTGKIAVEGCSSQSFIFKTDSIVASPYTIQYTIGGTATNGIDYTSINDSVTIPAGSDSAVVIINPIADSIVEGIESVVLKTFDCAMLSDTIYIQDNPTTTPSICMVSVDTTTNHNMVIWEKPVSNAINNYYIYRESSMAGVYNLIGTQSYSTYSIFIDTSSNSLQQPYRYELANLDTCGNLSLRSNYHQTIHLTINAGSNGSWNLIWNDYIGVTVNSYNIYRGTSKHNLTLLTSVSSNVTSYSDLTPPPGSIYYLLEAVTSTVCNPSKAVYNYSSIISNISSSPNTGIAEFDSDNFIHVSPNPANGLFTITLQSVPKQEMELAVLNSLGQEIVKDIMNTASKTIDLTGYSKGIYYLKISSGEKYLFRKIVIE